MAAREPNPASTYIEETFLSILSKIQSRPPGSPLIILKKPAPFQSAVLSNNSKKAEAGMPKEKSVTYRWPGKNREEAWRFGNHLTFRFLFA